MATATGLFEITDLGGMRLANRFVRSATFDGLADRAGAVTPAIVDLHARLARGGVGLVVAGYASVREDGRAYESQLGVHDDALVPGLTGLTEAVHREGGRIALQIVHCGAHSDPALIGREPAGPSAMQAADKPVCRAMQHDEIDGVLRAFGDAAARTRKADFDAVQIHAAHGYLLSEFLSPFYNRRTDEYGGSAPKRARIVLDVLRRVREAVGEGYPVIIKMNCTDFLDGGIELDDVLLLARELERNGIDGIEVSGGTIWGSRILGDANRMAYRTVQEEAYYREAAARLKREVSAPVILTGGIRSYDAARRLLEDGVADYIGLCRPLIREPDLVSRWRSGDLAGSACVSDNACFRPIAQGRGPVCVHLRPT
jgi:2,4-dienoyl-CoA reductase-like NADH-dependent reductase (Old Yellow Enzyme family)